MLQSVVPKPMQVAAPVRCFPAPGRSTALLPEPPAGGTRRWAADEFGIAADALTLASEQWMDPPYTNEGLLLTKASTKMRNALDALRALPRAADIIGSVEEAIDGASQLATVYMSGRVPDPLDDQPVAQLIQRWALDARTAQTYLAYACWDGTPAPPGNGHPTFAG